MVDDWLLEHLAKVTTLSCILIVVYFLLYSIWRISQMPNNPWNWNEWQWPIGGRHAVEIYRKPTEMPFTLSIDESTVENIGGCTFTLSYLTEKVPPQITVMWAPGASYLMRLINLSWDAFNSEIMSQELRPGEWKCLIDSIPESTNSWRETANYFILQRVHLEMEESEEELTDQDSINSVLPESYTSLKINLKPPIDFDWNLLQNQFRYPAVIFVTSPNENLSNIEGVCEINGIVQIVHVKNEVFRNSSTVLAQYIKMNNGQSHMLQSLYVMDDHRTDDEENDGANNSDLSASPPPQPPFRDILCSVCQVSPVTRVIIPCRHVCLCTQCFEKLESCPICRGHIMYYFRTRQDPTSSSPGVNSTEQGSSEESQNFTWWQRIERFNERFSDAMGLIRQY